MRLKILSFALLLAFCMPTQPVHAGITIVNGQVVNAERVATMPVDCHFEEGMRALEREDWAEAERQFNIVSANFPCTVYGHEALYYLGVACYNLDEFDFSNEALTFYLRGKQHPKYFLEAMTYKFNCAEELRCGAKRRFFGTKQLPKWACGRSLALEIYDEIIAALPCHELAVRALFSKGELQWDEGNYRESVEAFRMITKRFPKHELAPESYLMIMGVYLEQSRWEFQNPDILAFAQINLRKFKQDFPREERVACAEECLLAIKEIYARGLFDTGAFYERIGKPVAAALYYQNAENLFPETQVASWCYLELQRLQQCGIAVVLPAKEVEEETSDSEVDKDEDEFDFDESQLTDLDSER